MSKIDDFLRSSMSQDEEDDFMQKITHKRMDGIKKGYEQKLQNTYGVSKDNYQSKKVKKIGFAVVVTSIMIVFVYLLCVNNGIFDKQDYTRDIAAYIDNNKVHSYDIVRGNASDAVYNEYQQGNYKEALRIWENREMNLQDSFYVAMSQLYSGHYNEAETYFSALNKTVVSGDKFYPEQQLYQALTLLLLKEDKKATKIYQSWSKDSWMSREYSKITGFVD